MDYFKEKVVLITGGAAGIGKAAAIKFASEHAHTIIWDVNENTGAALEAEWIKKGYSIWFQKVNTTDSVAVEKAVDIIIAKYGKIDVLINNAGITRDSTIKKMTDEDWHAVIDVNLSGVFYTSRSVARHMIDKDQGRIINVSSVVGLYGNFGQTNYAATKSGIIGMTKTLARELGRKGITVNAVAPGFIETEMVAKMPENVLQIMKDKTPLGRLGRPEEIASAFHFLAGPGAAFINGATLSVDGGVVI